MLSPAEMRACRHESGLTVPTLGVTWTNCVNSRIVLTRRDLAPGVSALETPRTQTCRPPAAQGAPGDAIVPFHGAHAPPPLADPASMAIRHLHVVMSPRLPYCGCPFVVRPDGVWGTVTEESPPHDAALSTPGAGAQRQRTAYAHG
jgi:hypothetical protein